MKITRVLLIALVATGAGFLSAEDALAGCQNLGILETVKEHIKDNILGIIPISVSVKMRVTNPEEIQHPGTVTVKLRIHGVGVGAYVVQAYDANNNKVFEKTKKKAVIFSDDDEVRFGVSPFTTVAIGTALAYSFKRAVYCF